MRKLGDICLDNIIKLSKLSKLYEVYKVHKVYADSALSYARIAPIRKRRCIRKFRIVALIPYYRGQGPETTSIYAKLCRYGTLRNKNMSVYICLKKQSLTAWHRSGESGYI